MSLRTQQVRVVLFDAVGTLFHPAVPVAEVYGRFGRAHGSAYTDVAISSRFTEALAADEARDLQLHRNGETNEAWERARWQFIVQEVFDDLPDVDALLEVLWNHFAQPESWCLDAGALDLWRWLTERGIHVGIASNFDERLVSICEYYQIPSQERVFVSSVVGYRKPSARFFETIQASLGCAAAEILLVGDSMANDVLAAKAAGWQAVLLDPKNQVSYQLRLDSLRDLPTVLGGRLDWQ